MSRNAHIISRAVRRAMDAKPKKKPKPKVFTSVREVMERYGVKLPDEKPQGVLVILPRGYR